MLLSGLMSRVAAVPLAASMVVAYLTAHREEGFSSLGAFVEQTPFPYLLVALVVLAFGPGRVSLDWLAARVLGHGGPAHAHGTPEKP